VAARDPGGLCGARDVPPRAQFECLDAFEATVGDISFPWLSTKKRFSMVLLGVVALGERRE
jgi:hypothetical protein